MTNDNKIKLPTYIEVPSIKKDAMVGNGPFKASKDIQQSLGFPGEKVDNWQQVAIDKIAETKSKYRSVQVFLDSCVKCGACTDKCHYYLGTADPKNMPVARQDLFRSVYRRHFTFAGKFFPKLVGAKDFDENTKMSSALANIVNSPLLLVKATFSLPKFTTSIPKSKASSATIIP